MSKKYDFAGWATRNNLRCSDGRVILRDAFKNNDGDTVPLVWNHRHDDPYNVLGHALLENHEDGVRAYCTFNDTEQGRNAKALVENGDVTALSIYANKLKQQGSNVLHGIIREVSLILGGANPGAYIDSLNLVHSDDDEADDAIIYTGESLNLAHSEDETTDEKETEKMANGKKKTVEDVFNTLTDEQKTVVYALIWQALEDAQGGNDDDDEEEDSRMKHNVFDSYEEEQGGEITRFSQFDIDFNLEKYLIETRVSGALTKVYSAIALEQDVTAA